MSYKVLVSENAARILIPGLSMSVTVIEVVSEEECECRSPKALGQVLSGYITNGFMRKLPQIPELFKDERQAEIACLSDC